MVATAALAVSALSRDVAHARSTLPALWIGARVTRAGRMCEICDEREKPDNRVVYVPYILPAGGMWYCRRCLDRRDALLGVTLP